MKEYSIAFLGNITIYANSEADAVNAFADADLQQWAQIDTVQVTDENPGPHCSDCGLVSDELRPYPPYAPTSRICPDCWEKSI
jgi:hypothetical protein